MKGRPTMKKIISVSAIVVLVVAATTAAQSKPDFAGTWTLVTDPSAAALGGYGRTVASPLALGREFSVLQDQKTLTVVTNTNTQGGEVRTFYSLDGSETEEPLPAGAQKQNVERKSKVKWDGAKLVITTTSQFRPHLVFGDSWLPSCPSPSVYADMTDAVIRVSTLKSRQTWTLDKTGNLIVESTAGIDCNPTTAKATYKKG
jgi:hypothetical protein